MNTSRLLGIWAIFSILWATLYVGVIALAWEHMEFERIVSEILALPVLLLIVGGTIVRIIRGFRRPASGGKQRHDFVSGRPVSDGSGALRVAVKIVE